MFIREQLSAQNILINKYVDERDEWSKERYHLIKNIDSPESLYSNLFRDKGMINKVLEDFDKLDNIQTWHEDVNVYEVKDSDGSHIGILYEDLFPRKTKRSGAWMNELRSQGMEDDEVLRPHVTFTCNLTKSTETTPSLLTFMEVTTIFHEFGHCLHGLLSDCKYTSSLF